MQRLADKFNDKKKKGLVKAHGSGFGGSGFRFDFHEDDAHNAIKKRHAIEYKTPGDDEGGGDAAAARGKEDMANAWAGAEASAADVRGQGAAKYTYTSLTEQPPEVANISDVRPSPVVSCLAL